MGWLNRPDPSLAAGAQVAPTRAWTELAGSGGDGQLLLGAEHAVAGIAEAGDDIADGVEVAVDGGGEDGDVGVGFAELDRKSVV